MPGQFLHIDYIMRCFWDRLFRKSEPAAQNIGLPIILFECRQTIAAYKAILHEMDEILRRNGYLAESDFIRDALGKLAAGSTDFASMVTGRGMWGGSGSVSDCLFEANARENVEEARLDDSRMVELLALLVRRLVSDGMKNSRIESLGEMYERASRNPNPKRPLGSEPNGT